ncbi:MAG: hypothetical protein ACYS22_04395 [Planctomycetota bacterium]|jgi:hypothetical protein
MDTKTLFLTALLTLGLAGCAGGSSSDSAVSDAGGAVVAGNVQRTALDGSSTSVLSGAHLRLAPVGAGTLGTSTSGLTTHETFTDSAGRFSFGLGVDAVSGPHGGRFYRLSVTDTKVLRPASASPELRMDMFLEPGMNAQLGTLPVWSSTASAFQVGQTVTVAWNPLPVNIGTASGYRITVFDEDGNEITALTVSGTASQVQFDASALPREARQVQVTASATRWVQGQPVFASYGGSIARW